MIKGKILILDKAHDVLLEGLKSLHFEIEHHAGAFISEFALDDYCGIIVNSKSRISKEIINQAIKIDFLGRLASGIEFIDTQYLQNKQIELLRTPEGNCDSVGEHALALMLAMSCKIREGEQEVRFNDEKWDRESCRGIEIYKKTIGLIGFGHTAKAFAKRLSGMGVNIIAYDKYNPSFPSEYQYVESVSLEEVQKRADILSIHLPLTEETHYMIDEAFLSSCKKGVIIINTARGSHINTQDLIRGLINGQILSAALDVLENEHPSTYTQDEKRIYQQLHRLPNVVLTPHVAGWTKASHKRHSEVMLQKIGAFYNKKLQVSDQ